LIRLTVFKNRPWSQNPPFRNLRVCRTKLNSDGVHVLNSGGGARPGAIQSDALTLRIFVIRLVGSDLRGEPVLPNVAQ
jgi:hypothetical protein